MTMLKHNFSISLLNPGQASELGGPVDFCAITADGLPVAYLADADIGALVHAALRAYQSGPEEDMTTFTQRLCDHNDDLRPVKLTPDQRHALVDVLMDDFLSGISGSDGWIREIGKDGFVGFKQRSDAELVKACRDADLEWVLDDQGIKID